MRYGFIVRLFYCLIAVLLLVVIGQLSFVKPANAQFQSADRQTNYLNTNPDVPQNLHTYTQSVFINIAAATSCILTGTDPLNPRGKCLGIDTKTNKIGYVEGGQGLVGITTGLLAFTFYIPVSTHDYGSMLASSFGIVKPAHAQGVGFKGLEPTLRLWEAFRNITYMFFVVAFVIVGLGIMFRIKIDPRTVMTLQNQIPKIIIALILVTFSYAIAGFMIDLMYVSLYLIVSVFRDTGVDTGSIFGSNPLSAAGGLGGMSGIAASVAKSFGAIISSFLDGTLGEAITGVMGLLLGLGAGAALGGPIGGFIGLIIGGFAGATLGNELLGFIGGLIAYIVVVIALLVALIRLWFILIKSYIYILISVVLAPFYIAAGLIPGLAGFGGWIRSLLSNLVVFPATAAMLLLGKSFIDGFSRAEPGSMPFVPPYVGSFLDPELLASIIGLAIILMLPEVANMAKAALKAPETKYTSAVGAGVGMGAGIASGGPRLAWQRLMRPPKWMGDTGGPMYSAIHGMPGPVGRLIRIITGVHKP
jgi:hypothetical protein